MPRPPLLESHISQCGPVNPASHMHEPVVESHAPCPLQVSFLLHTTVQSSPNRPSMQVLHLSPVKPGKHAQDPSAAQTPFSPHVLSVHCVSHSAPYNVAAHISHDSPSKGASHSQPPSTVHRPRPEQSSSALHMCWQSSPENPSAHSSHESPALFDSHSHVPSPRHRPRPLHVSFHMHPASQTPPYTPDVDGISASLSSVVAAEQTSQDAPVHPASHSHVPDAEHLPRPLHVSDALHHMSQSLP